MGKKLKSLPYSGYDNKDVMDIRTLVKSIKFSCNDLAIARKRMEKAGYTNFSTFGRDCILATEIVERITSQQQELLRELLRERNNINQIARSVNAGIAKPEDAKRGLYLLDQVYELMFRIANK